MRGRRPITGAIAHEPETLHPRPRAPGYFDSCPREARASNREGTKGPRDITANVQLYLPERELGSDRMRGPLVGNASSVNNSSCGWCDSSLHRATATPRRAFTDPGFRSSGVVDP